MRSFSDKLPKPDLPEELALYGIFCPPKQVYLGGGMRVTLMQAIDDRFHIKDLFDRGLHDGGMIPWSITMHEAPVLGGQLISDIASLFDKNVADIGAGSGLFGILAKQLGARRVFSIDSSPGAAAIIPVNAAMNGVELDVLCADANALDAEQDFFRNIDVVIAADVYNVNPGRTALCQLLGRLARAGKTIYTTSCDENLAKFLPLGEPGWQDLTQPPSDYVRFARHRPLQAQR